jgi:hypothetical protein
MLAALGVAIENAYRRTLFQETRRCGRADSAGTACYEHTFPFESAHSFSSIGRGKFPSAAKAELICSELWHA